MAKLTPVQAESVASWAASGCSLNDIQVRLKSELNLTLTYLDTRMLLIEHGIQLLEKPKPPPEPSPLPAAPEAPEPVGLGSPDHSPQPEQTPAAGPAGKVQVSLDQVTIPGAIASGKAVFSDGKSITWYVDQMGRLGMRAAEAGYQPPPADIAQFEMQLDRLLQGL